jgi:pyruvate-ferredoxin/flavodoxin oxidoreductase
MGASDAQAVKALLEAESYNGPSLVIAYSHCIAQGIDMRKGMDQQKAAVDSGAWILYRYDPRLAAEGKNPLQIDSKPPTISLEQYAYNEDRFKMLTKMSPEVAKDLLTKGQKDVLDRQNLYRQMAEMKQAQPAQAAPQPATE